MSAPVDSRCVLDIQVVQQRSFLAFTPEHGIPVSTPRYHGRAAFDPAIVATIAEALRVHWDPDGALADAAAAMAASDDSSPATYEQFALAIAGLLAAGGSEAEVSRYLRLEEERLLGAARSTGRIRWPIARFAWRTVRDLDPAPPTTRTSQEHMHALDRHIFFEIALQSDRGGASRDVIRNGVDLRQKLRLTDDELEAGLRRLQKAGLIEATGLLFTPTARITATLPRPPRGAVSTRADLWRRLAKRLFAE
jgi:hypothetical protein